MSMLLETLRKSWYMEGRHRERSRLMRSRQAHRAQKSPNSVVSCVYVVEQLLSDLTLATRHWRSPRMDLIAFHLSNHPQFRQFFIEMALAPKFAGQAYSANVSPKAIHTVCTSPRRSFS